MFLITLPDFEVATRYASKWAERVAEYAKKQKNIEVVSLVRDKANKKNVEGYLKKQPINLVMFNGHGDNETIYGHNNEVLIKKDVNASLLKSKIVYVVACNCASSLGPHSVDFGCNAFIGYKRPFSIAANSIYIHNPLSDDRAKPFFEASNCIVVSLLKGHTVKEACNKSKQLIMDSIKRLLTSQATSDDLMDASLLSWNYTNLVHLGNENGRV